MKRFIFAFLLCVLSPAWAQNLLPAPPTVPATTTRDGLTIAPLGVEETDADSMLEIKLWRFKIQSPAPNSVLRYRLELRRPDEEPVEIMPSNAWPMLTGEPTEMTFGIMPATKESFQRVESLKLYTRLENGSSKVVDQDRRTGYFPNPMRDLKIMRYGFIPFGAVDQDGAASLLVFKTDDTPGEEPIKLVLVLTAKKRDEPAKK